MRAIHNVGGPGISVVSDTPEDRLVIEAFLAECKDGACVVSTGPRIADHGGKDTSDGTMTFLPSPLRATIKQEPVKVAPAVEAPLPRADVPHRHLPPKKVVVAAVVRR